jgi:hypothetical protein
MHTWRLRASVIVLGLCGVVAVPTAQTQPLPAADQAAPIIQELVAIQDFQRRVDDYVTLHRLLEGPLPPLRPTINMDEVYIVMRTLATRIVAARPHAAQGDVIGPEAARVFKRRIITCLSPEAWSAILADFEEDIEGVPVPPVTLKVNMPWPEDVPYAFMPPRLLAALPPLPPELQYRFIGRSLVLWDHHANLIVDFVPGVFASTT